MVVDKTVLRFAVLLIVLLTMFSIPLAASSISVVNNCAGNSLCVVEGSESGIGTIEFTLHILTEGNNVDGLGNPGPGGSGSVTIEQDAFTEGPIRPGFIEFSYDLATTTTLTVGGTVSASFAVAGITGNVPGEVGVPTPYEGQLLTFTLGVPFEITASASFSVPPATGPPGSSFTKSVADAGVGFSFLVFDDEGNLVTIENPPADLGGDVPEPATLALLAIGGLCFLCRRALSTGSTGNCRGFALMRSAKVSILSRNRLPGPGASPSYPILRFDQFSSRSLSKNYREHYGQRCSSSAFNAVHVTPFCRS